MGPENYFNGDYPVLFESNVFTTQFHTDFYDGMHIAGAHSGRFKKLIEPQKETIIENALSRFTEEKGTIIQEELQFAVNNWDAEYYAYEDEVVEDTALPTNMVTTQPSNTETTQVVVNYALSEEDEKLTLPANAEQFIGVPHFAPRNVKLASYALNTCKKPADYIKYAGLVREAAFEDVNYTDLFTLDTKEYNDCNYDISFDIPFGLNERDAKKQITEAFEEQVNSICQQDTEESKYRLSKRLNLNYYIVDFDGNVFSNIEEIPANLSNYSHYVLANEKNVTVKGFENTDIKYELEKKNVKKLCMYFNEKFSEEDVYGNIVFSYNSVATDNANKVIITLAVLLILFLAMLLLWLRLIGKRVDSDTPKTSFVEKLPNDIHTIISFGAIAGLVYWYTDAFWYDYYSNTFPEKKQIGLLVFFGCLCISLFTEWLASVVRTKKAKESYFKNTAIFKLFVVLRYVAKKLFKIFEYKPKAFKLRFVLLFAGYLLVNTLLLAFIMLGLYDEPAFCLVFVPLFIAFNGAVGYFLVDYVNTLDKIIVSSAENENIEFSNKKVPNSLKILADNLSHKNRIVDEAVCEAIKKEHLKTQLITNVSHDLKTPLTSLISYSDLLSKCEIEDEAAIKYIEVINQQSDKLKRLIEDLIEASKVSTGNVTLNKTKLNLSELAVQAIVEFTPDFERNGNEIRFNEPENPSFIMADGVKTYRIISNLLSNAKKYSAPHTRVYASVYTKGAFGCFEIKNISNEPLNISANELTERFVRGDESRTKEGNGLGLSIAKDLCNIQNGDLEIIIDGDLFKVIVKLPLSE